MKKVLSVALLFCLFLSLISCGKKPITEDEDYVDDFHGATFTVYSDVTWLNSGLPCMPANRKCGVNASTGRFSDKIEENETDYNAVIGNEHGNLQSRILAMSLSGGGGADIFYCGNDVPFIF